MVEKLRKIKQYASREQMRKGKLYVKTYWNKPKEGEYVSVREFVAFCVSASGGNIYMFGAGFIGFNAGFFCGAIMGITVMDFYKIGIIGMVSGYAFTWMTPLNMLIYENFGRLDKKVRNTAHVAMAVKLAVGAAAYMMPSDMFESFLHGMPQIIGNTLVISVFNFYSDWLCATSSAKSTPRQTVCADLFRADLHFALRNSVHQLRRVRVHRQSGVVALFVRVARDHDRRLRLRHRMINFITRTLSNAKSSFLSRRFFTVCRSRFCICCFR